MSETEWPPYHLTLDYNIPCALLDSKACTNIDIEIGGLTADDAEQGLQNGMHFVLHFASTDGISALSLRAVRGRGNDKKGYLILVPVAEPDPSGPTSILRLDIEQGWTLAEILRNLMDSNVQHFDFIPGPQGRLCGRRDVLSQIIRVWERTGFVKSTNYTCAYGMNSYLDCIYTAMCQRYAENTTMFSAIGKCEFTDGYEREELHQANYLE